MNTETDVPTPARGNRGKFYVYIYRDPRTGKDSAPIYVGKGRGKRAKSHWLHDTHNVILRRILAKIRKAGLEPSIQIIAWFDDEASAFELERAEIARLGRLDRRTGPLANMTDGGDGVSGWDATPEYRKKQAINTARRWQDKDYARAMSQMSRSRWADLDARAARISNMEAARSDPDYRHRLSVGIKKRYKTSSPEQIAARVKGMHTPEARARKAKSIRAALNQSDYIEYRTAKTVEQWADPEIRNRTLSSMKTAHSRPEEKKRKAVVAKAAWPDRKASIVAGNKKSWADPVRRAKRIEAIRAARRRKSTEIENDRTGVQTAADAD